MDVSFLLTLSLMCLGHADRQRWDTDGGLGVGVGGLRFDMLKGGNGKGGRGVPHTQED